ncbi:ADP-ribosylation factor [Desarmillaria tabescens]|uniref:ADP-ribosylation factor n=1 Tax=Armillaria tabescens TaxID=1929756 RepID=A0AA39NBC6_ARMTA|nr:ADP-ribosylation factor [Desarmillaria tabescens]KAK0462486.1 ADP-ribosylation factor [Desarmillaria tabescens]
MLRQFIDRYFLSKGGHTVTFLGLDYAGKTTLLYLLKLNQVLPTISTFGFNVETVDVPLAGRRRRRLTCWDAGTGCGIHGVYPLLRMFVETSAGVVWVVDSTDRERIDESIETFSILVTGVTNNGIPILILATKQDLPGAMSVDEIRVKFARAISGRNAFVFGAALVQPDAIAALSAPFEWFIAAIQTPSTTTASKQPPVASENSDPLELDKKLSAWLARTETDTPPEEFIAQFLSAKLSAWDHYTHIRIAYVILTTYGRQKGKDMIFDGIEKFIARSSIASGRTYHVTMTYFWIQLVHLGIRNMPPSSALNASDITLVESFEPSPEDFIRFLLMNSHLLVGNLSLWTVFYSKDVMMSPEAKAGVVLPDKKPLPNLVVRDAISRVHVV